MNVAKSFFAIALFCGSIPWARAQVTVTENFAGINAAIPDDNTSGFQDTRHISYSLGPITDVSVTLNVSGTGAGGAVNGDFYAYLTHGSATAILLNRPGVRSGSSLGYDDNGFSSVTFNDSASNGDVHFYRRQLFNDDTTRIPPAPSPLTGTWAPDGRFVLPRSSGTTIESTPRTALLGTFNNANMQGDWTLFISDVSGGGTARLASWSLTVTAVPEPREIGIAIGLGLLGFALIRKKISP
jgi:hypothetical protein